MSSAGSEAVDLAASAGLYLDEWQKFTLDVGLGERADGKWAAFEVGLIVTRQNGKGAVLEALELAGLFLFGERLILHSAHEFKTAQEAFRRVLALIENTDHLRKRVARVRTSHGEEGVELLDGARLRFVARSTGSGRGFSADRVILDEAYNLPVEAMAALLPTLSSRENPQIWYTSSAGMLTSHQLRAVRERGRAGDDPGLAYLEWSAADDAAIDDRAAWAQANPSLGIRITEEFIERELAAMSAAPAEFARERLGIWENDQMASSGIPTGAWGLIIGDDVTPTGTLSFGFDVNPERSLVSLVASDGTNHELLEPRPAIATAVDAVVAAVGRSVVGIDPASPAGAFIAELEQRGVKVMPIGGTGFAQACGAFYDAAVGGQIRIRRNPALDAANDGARVKPAGDAWKWDRRDASVDVSPLVAVTLAYRTASVSPPPVTPGFLDLDDFLTDEE